MKKAHFYSEGDGMYATGCKTVDEAIMAMKKHYSDWDIPAEVESDYGFPIDAIKADKIKADTAYYHRTCGFTTIGESYCLECNEPMRGHGKEVFTLTIDN